MLRRSLLVCRDDAQLARLASVVESSWPAASTAPAESHERGGPAHKCAEPAPQLLTRSQLPAAGSGTTAADSAGSSSGDGAAAAALLLPPPPAAAASSADGFGPPFNLASFFGNLRARTTLGSLLCYARVIGSTQTFLTARFGGVQEGLLCVADVQSAGRGRSANMWESPAGSLSFSFKSAFRDAKNLPFVQYLASLAVVRALHDASGGRDIGVRIKWPNDLYATQGGGAVGGATPLPSAALKVGGVLCTSTFADGKFDVTTGIGLNFRNEHPTTCLDALLRAAVQREHVADGAAAADGGSGRGGGGGGSAEQGAVALQVSRESFLAAFANHFDAMAAQFEQEGFAPFREAYMQHWLHSGQEVTVKGRDGEPDAKMRIEGLTNSGALRTVDVISGEAFELYPDGNSFDFFQGLIKQKL
jgi:biotin---protein ligase